MKSSAKGKGAKYNKEICKTGGGEIDPDIEILSTEDEMICSMIGKDGIVGFGKDSEAEANKSFKRMSDGNFFKY